MTQRSQPNAFQGEQNLDSEPWSTSGKLCECYLSVNGAAAVSTNYCIQPQFWLLHVFAGSVHTSMPNTHITPPCCCKITSMKYIPVANRYNLPVKVPHILPVLLNVKEPSVSDMFVFFLTYILPREVEVLPFIF